MHQDVSDVKVMNVWTVAAGEMTETAVTEDAKAAGDVDAVRNAAEVVATEDAKAVVSVDAAASAVKQVVNAGAVRKEAERSVTVVRGILPLRFPNGKDRRYI